MKNKISFLIFFVFSFQGNSFSNNLFEVNFQEIVVDLKDEKKDFSLKNIESGKNVYLSDVLKNESEIDLKRRAISGDTSDMLSIRGLSSNRLLLNLNGRSLNSAGVVGGHYIDYSVLPMDNIERIQILKGAGDVKYGNNALGGIMNIVTKEPKEKLETLFFLNYGSSKDINYIENYRFINSYKKNFFGYVFGGSYQNFDEFFWNNKYKAKNIFGNFYFDMPKESKLFLSVQYTNSNRGFIINNRQSSNPNNPLFYQKINEDYPLAFGDNLNPYGGNISLPGPDSYWIKERTLLDLNYKIAIKDFLTEFKIYKNIENRFEYNYSSHLINPSYSKPDGTLIFKRKVEADRSWGSRIDFSKEFKNNQIEFGSEYKYLGYGDIKVYYVDMTYGCSGLTCSSTKPSQEAKILSYYIKDNLYLNEKINIILGLRYDDYQVNAINGLNSKELYDSTLNPAFNFLYKLNAKNEFSFNLYTKARTPSMPEVYWWSNGITSGNNQLKSENNYALEMNGLHTFNENSNLRFSCFYYDIKDYIMFKFDINSGSGRAVYNIDNVKIWGSSFDLKTKILNKINLYTNLTLQNSKKGYDPYDNGLLKELDYMPKFKYNLNLEYAINFKNYINFSYKYLSNQKTVYSYKDGTYKYSLENLKAYNIFDIEYKLRYNKNLEFSIYCENMFNENYSEKFSYPMSKRIIGITGKFIF